MKRKKITNLKNNKSNYKEEIDGWENVVTRCERICKDFIGVISGKKKIATSIYVDTTYDARGTEHFVCVKTEFVDVYEISFRLGSLWCKRLVEARNMTPLIVKD